MISTFTLREKPVGLDNEQADVLDWTLDTFGPEIAGNVDERCCRFLEEALELVQALDLSLDKVIKLVDYVYNRPVGEPKQEMGGSVITLLALSSAAGIRAEEAFADEMARCYEKMEEIRNKHMLKTLRGDGI